jgi:hypothetical protein
MSGGKFRALTGALIQQRRGFLNQVRSGGICGSWSCNPDLRTSIYLGETLKGYEVVNGSARFTVVVVAIFAGIGVLFVLITPAADELPNIGPHAANTIVRLVLSFDLPSRVSSSPRPATGLMRPLSCVELLSLTCSRLR